MNNLFHFVSSFSGPPSPCYPTLLKHHFRVTLNIYVNKKVTKILLQYIAFHEYDLQLLITDQCQNVESISKYNFFNALQDVASGGFQKKSHILNHLIILGWCLNQRKMTAVRIKRHVLLKSSGSQKNSDINVGLKKQKPKQYFMCITYHKLYIT